MHTAATGACFFFCSEMSWCHTNMNRVIYIEKYMSLVKEQILSIITNHDMYQRHEKKKHHVILGNHIYPTCCHPRMNPRFTSGKSMLYQLS